MTTKSIPEMSCWLLGVGDAPEAMDWSSSLCGGDGGAPVEDCDPPPPPCTRSPPQSAHPRHSDVGPRGEQGRGQGRPQGGQVGERQPHLTRWSSGQGI